MFYSTPKSPWTKTLSVEKASYKAFKQRFSQHILSKSVRKWILAEMTSLNTTSHNVWLFKAFTENRRHYLLLKHLTQIYDNLIYPYILHAIVAWGSTSKTNLQKKQTKPKHVIRLMFFALGKRSIIKTYSIRLQTEDSFRTHMLLPIAQATTDRDAWFLDSISSFLHSKFSLFKAKQSKHPWSFNCHSYKKICT